VLEASLELYVAEVLRFSKALNLTSVHNAGEFRSRFIEPSLAMCEIMPEQGRLLDIGSGMGIPGIPVLLARPGLYGLLVERRQKRAEFLRHLKRMLGLQAEIYDEDVRNLLALDADVIVARAVAAPLQLLHMCTRHSRKGTIAVLSVSRGAGRVSVPGWRFMEECRFQSNSGAMSVHKYIYEDVSRET